MKKLTFQNKDIPVLVGFLHSTSLKPAATRGKYKLIDRLEEKRKEYSRDEMELIKTVAKLDEDGEVLFNDKGKPVVRKNVTTQEFNEYMDTKKELDDEEIVIEFFEHSKKYESLFTGLEEYDHEIPAEVSYGYELLMNAYENQEDEKDETTESNA